VNGRRQPEGGHGRAPDTIRIRVVPRSSREEVAGFSEGAVRIRVAPDEVPLWLDPLPDDLQEVRVLLGTSQRPIEEVDSPS